MPTPERHQCTVTSRFFFTSDGVRLHVSEAGPAEGPPVLLLHGFPEFWRGWRHQIPALAEAGYRVLVPDQRGYNRSDAPPRVADYDLSRLAADVTDLLNAFNIDRVRLVGHDWGAIVAWAVAAWHPDRVHSLAILNVPHPRVFQRTLVSNLDQLRRSWYIAFFQIPRLPEWLLSRNDHDALIRMMVGSGRTDTFDADDLSAYRAAWHRSGVGPMIHWYRAAARRVLTGGRSVGHIEPKTLVIWGKEDIALPYEMAAPSVAMCDRGRLEGIPDATHWVQHDAAERVNRLLLAHWG